MFFNSNPSDAKLLQIPLETEVSYLNFTKSVSRTKKDRLDDLQRLISNPHIKQLAFFRGVIEHGYTRENNPTDIDWMLIGTSQVTIETEEYTFTIGEFIVYLNRISSDGHYHPTILVENVTIPDPRNGGPRHQGILGSQNHLCGHPHVAGNRDSFCMSDGTNELQHAMVDADIVTAFSIIDAALRSYGPYRPFCDINRWPKTLKF